MSAEKLIVTMEKLLKLHKSLYEIALKKTETVKIGDIEALNQQLKDEQAHLAAINKIEKERKETVSVMVPDIDQPTLLDCLKTIEGANKKILSRLRIELLELVSKLQQTNELNQQMIYQSLQFVNFSLNLIAPQPEQFNYGPNGGKKNSSGTFAGMFNSKV